MVKKPVFCWPGLSRANPDQPAPKRENLGDRFRLGDQERQRVEFRQRDGQAYEA